MKLKEIDPYIADAGIAIPAEDEKYNMFHSPTTGEFSSSGGGAGARGNFLTQDPSATMFGAVQKQVGDGPLEVKMGPWRKGGMGSADKSRTLTVQVKSAPEGFAQTVIWHSGYGAERGYTIQQQDISLPQSMRGTGLGGEMMAGLVAGYRAVGAKNIPVHMDTNPTFWSHMRKTYPSTFSKE